MTLTSMQKKYKVLVYLFFVGSISLQGMELVEQENKTNDDIPVINQEKQVKKNNTEQEEEIEEDENFEEYDEVEEDVDLESTNPAELARLKLIKNCIKEGRYGQLQELVRHELEQEKTVTFGSWLRKHAFTKGEAVLLYELVRYSLKYEKSNIVACKAGLKALLILLIRVYQDVTIMNSVFDQRTWIDLVQQMRKKTIIWWQEAALQGMSQQLEFKKILKEASDWFANRSFAQYANPATVIYWNLKNIGYASFIADLAVKMPCGQVGLIFRDVPAQTFSLCSGSSTQEAITSLRNAIATRKLEEYDTYHTWDAFIHSLYN